MHIRCRIFLDAHKCSAFETLCDDNVAFDVCSQINIIIMLSDLIGTNCKDD